MPDKVSRSRVAWSEAHGHPARSDSTSLPGVAGIPAACSCERRTLPICSGHLAFLFSSVITSGQVCLIAKEWLHSDFSPAADWVTMPRVSLLETSSLAILVRWGSNVRTAGSMETQGPPGHPLPVHPHTSNLVDSSVRMTFTVAHGSPCLCLLLPEEGSHIPEVRSWGVCAPTLLPSPGVLCWTVDPQPLSGSSTNGPQWWLAWEETLHLLASVPCNEPLLYTALNTVYD